MGNQRVIFRVHAVQRMFERNISLDDVLQILKRGEVIERYPDDKPFPSRLILGRVGTRALHVVAADDVGTDRIIVVTVYEPESSKWEGDFKRRKK